VHFDGITFTFADGTLLAAGERIVVVKTQTLFQQLYGPTPRIGGVFLGALDNSGEEIAVIAANGTDITRFVYNDKSPWPTEADGLGYTLTRIFPSTLPAGDPMGWRVSAALTGSPAASDGQTFSGTALSDVDADGIGALVEYAMGTNPANGASGPPDLVPSFDLDGRMTLSFPHNLLAEDATCIVEYSDGLSGWLPAEFVTRVNSGTDAVETWRAPVFASTRQFLRLRVTK
jgi:hypothetical protein